MSTQIISLSVSIETQALIIYQLYPLKVSKPQALRAISKAIKIFGFDFVKERTELYARIRGNDKAFMPYPATWYNGERFNDDPQTWKSNDTHTSINRKSFDRNKGTLNEGTAHLYKVKPIQSAPTKPSIPIV